VRVSVVRCGRRGAVLAACLAASGHDVVAVGTDASTRRWLRAGAAGTTEPRLRRLLALALMSGRLHVTGDRTVVAGARVHVLPGDGEDDGADPGAATEAVSRAAEEVAPHLGPGDLVVGRAPVEPGTASWLAATLAGDGVRASVVWVPDERRPGRAVLDTLRPARLVYGLPAGTEGERAAVILDTLHAVQLAAGAVRTTTDLRTAESVGLAPVLRERVPAVAAPVPEAPATRALDALGAA